MVKHIALQRLPTLAPQIGRRLLTPSSFALRRISASNLTTKASPNYSLKLRTLLPFLLLLLDPFFDFRFKINWIPQFLLLQMATENYTFGPYKIDSKEVFYSTRLSYAMVNLRPLLPGMYPHDGAENENWINVINEFSTEIHWMRFLHFRVDFPLIFCVKSFVCPSLFAHNENRDWQWCFPISVCRSYPFLEEIKTKQFCLRLCLAWWNGKRNVIKNDNIIK